MRVFLFNVIKYTILLIPLILLVGVGILFGILMNDDDQVYDSLYWLTPYDE